MDKNQSATKTAEEKPDTLKLIRMSEIATEAVKWLWYGNTTYEVYIHYSQTSKETLTDKVMRLIRNDICNVSEF